jgi:hypothetical protein
MPHEYTVVHSDGGTESHEPSVGSKGYSPYGWSETEIFGHNLQGISAQPLPIDYVRTPGDPSTTKSLQG